MEFVCLVWISEQTANFAVCNHKRLMFITEVESVYCAVRTESLYNTDTFRLQNVNVAFILSEKSRLNWTGHVNRMDSKRKVSNVTYLTIILREVDEEDDQQTDGGTVYKQIQWKPLIMITLGLALFDNNNRLITLSGGY
jgi:hypothetical protein